MALLASKDYSGTNVPAICVDLKQNKKIGQVAIEGQRVGLAPENTLLSPNGEHLIMAMVEYIFSISFIFSMLYLDTVLINNVV